MTYHYNKRIHTQLRIVRVLFRESGVDDVVDTIDGDARFGNVGGDNDLSRTRRSRVENPRLHLGRQGGVDRQNQQIRNLWPQCLHSLVEHFTRSVDLFLSRQEQEDIAWWLRKMDLHDSDQGSVQVIAFRLLRVEDFDRESSTGDSENRTAVKVLGELFSIQGG